MTWFPGCFRRCRPYLIAVLLCVAPPALAQSFFQSIDDLPLAPGLTESADEGVSFDSPGGRIVTAVAQGADSIEAYRRFYDDALPALGWKRLADGRYRRDDEVLSLEFKPREGRVEVRIGVVPAGSEKAR